MIKTLEKCLFAALYFAGLGSTVSDDEDKVVIKAFTSGALFILSIYTTFKEYSTFIDQEYSKCLYRPIRIGAPIINAVTTGSFFVSDILKHKIREINENDSIVIQACYSGFTFALIMESITTWKMAIRLGKKSNQFNSMLSLLTSGALMIAVVGNIESLASGPSIESNALMVATGLSLFQAAIWGKNECTELRNKVKERTYSSRNNIQGNLVPNPYSEPFLLTVGNLK